MRIQRLEDFSPVNEDFDFMKILSGLGSGGSNVIKGLVFDTIMGTMGFDKDSFMGKIIKNVIYRMELTKISKYFTGDKKAIAEWADAIVVGIVAAFEEELIDKIFIDFMKIDKNSPVYKILRESFKNAINDEIFKKHIRDGVVQILGGQNEQGKAFSPMSLLNKINT